MLIASLLILISSAHADWQFPPLAHKLIAQGRHEAAAKIVLDSASGADFNAPEIVEPILDEASRSPEFGLQLLSKLIAKARETHLLRNTTNKNAKYFSALGLDIHVLEQQDARLLSINRFHNPWEALNPISLMMPNKKWVGVFAGISPMRFDSFVESERINEFTVGYTMKQQPDSRLQTEGFMLQPRFSESNKIALYHGAVFFAHRESGFNRTHQTVTEYFRLAQNIIDGIHVNEINSDTLYLLATMNPDHPQTKEQFFEMMQFGVKEKNQNLIELALEGLSRVAHSGREVQIALFNQYNYPDEELARKFRLALQYIAFKEKKLAPEITEKLFPLSLGDFSAISFWAQVTLTALTPFPDSIRDKLIQEGSYSSISILVRAKAMNDAADERLLEIWFDGERHPSESDLASISKNKKARFIEARILNPETREKALKVALSLKTRTFSTHYAIALRDPATRQAALEGLLHATSLTDELFTLVKNLVPDPLAFKVLAKTNSLRPEIVAMILDANQTEAFRLVQDVSEESLLKVIPLIELDVSPVRFQAQQILQRQKTLSLNAFVAVLRLIAKSNDFYTRQFARAVLSKLVSESAHAGKYYSRSAFLYLKPKNAIEAVQLLDAINLAVASTQPDGPSNPMFGSDEQRFIEMLTRNKEMLCAMALAGPAL